MFLTHICILVDILYVLLYIYNWNFTNSTLKMFYSEKIGLGEVLRLSNTVLLEAIRKFDTFT